MRQAQAAGDPIQIAVVDSLMPDTDGEMLGRAIKSDAHLGNTALMLLTSVARDGESSDLHQKGFTACLMKPARPMDLLDALAVMRAAAANPNSSVPMITRYSLAEIRLVEKRQSTAPTTVLNAHILVAEDNAVNREVAVRLLEKFGCRVDVARNGIEAVEMWSLQRYDAILMDCQMPEMDGYEATAEIRRREAGDNGGTEGRIPILALTASAMEADVKKCRAAGMDDFISKPVQAKDLRAVMDRWVQPAAHQQFTEVCS